MENSLDRSILNVQRQFPLGRDPVSTRGRAPVPQRCPRRPSFRTVESHLIPGRRAKAEILFEHLNSSGDQLRVAGFKGKDIDSGDVGVDGALLISSQLQVLPGTLVSSSIPAWDSVAQVVCVLEEDISCPICLYPPTVPRISRCGHIYCGPCASQYISYENDGSSKKCAVCCSLISLNELKRVILSHVPLLKVGDDLEMVLVGRKKSVFGLDICGSSLQAQGADTSHIYQFVTEASPSDITSRGTDELETLFLYKAECQRDGSFELIAHINQLIEHVMEERLLAGPLASASRSVDNGEKPSEHICFYQAVDGRLIFLDGLMWNCLLAEHGTVSNLPSTLMVRVTSMRSHKMCPSLRKRWRHLSHLPLGRVFVQVEIELQHLVSEAALNKFSARLEARRLEHDRRRLEDLRLTKLKEDTENRIHFLPHGFVLSGPAPLSYEPDQFPQPPNLRPACSTSVPSAVQGPSFAEVTKKGALSVVDRNRVATFERGSINRPCIPAFSPSAECWPSLNDSACAKSAHAGDPSRLHPCPVNPTPCDERPSQGTTSSISTAPIEKRSRKRRSRILTPRCNETFDHC